jgi:hypothetical protein
LNPQDLISSWLESAIKRNNVQQKIHFWRIKDFLCGYNIRVGCSALFVLNNCKNPDQAKIILDAIQERGPKEVEKIKTVFNGELF